MEAITNNSTIEQKIKEYIEKTKKDNNVDSFIIYGINCNDILKLIDGNEFTKKWSNEFYYKVTIILEKLKENFNQLKS